MLYVPGGEGFVDGVRPHEGTSSDGSSTLPASTNPYGLRPETQPHKLTAPIRPVTWAWGEQYPCCSYDPLASVASPPQCGGFMVPQRRSFRYERKGRLWRKFKCNRCKRTATDWKTA